MTSASLPSKRRHVARIDKAKYVPAISNVQPDPKADAIVLTRFGIRYSGEPDLPVVLEALGLIPSTGAAS